MKYLNIFSNFKTHLICKAHGIEKYYLDKDGKVNVDGNVNLSYKELTKIPVVFGEVSGSFDISNNYKLTSLYGCPTKVGGSFACSYNRLTSLEGCPTFVGRNFKCESNRSLTSLEGCPKNVVGNFICNRCDILELLGIGNIGGRFDCHDNLIHIVWDLFKDKSKIELFNYFDPIRPPEGVRPTLPLRMQQSDWNKNKLNPPIIYLTVLNAFLEEIGLDPVKNVRGYECR